MDAEIYYFSGTGNSLAIARDLADRIPGSLIPIASMRFQKSVMPGAGIIGIVFPVYYGELPVMVREFIEKLESLEGKYIFAVSTYGGAAMTSLWVLHKMLKAKGATLSAAYGVQMPQNSFVKPREKPQKLYALWARKLEAIVKNTQQKKRTPSHAPLDLFFVPFQYLFIRPLCGKHFARQSGLPHGTVLSDLIHAMDAKFYTNKNCSGCGLCAVVCPAGNIMMREGKPVWTHHCETCLACYHWCPGRAIQGGIAPSGYYYHHPNVSVSEIMRQGKP